MFHQNARGRTLHTPAINSTASENLNQSAEHSQETNDTDPTSDSRKSVCKRYKQEIHLVHVVEAHALGNRDTSDDLVCLLTQLTYSRVERLQMLAQHWKGQAS